MSASTKLSTSVKALCLLAKEFPKEKTSSHISKETGVNASKIRWLLSKLQKTGIIQSEKGSRGGFKLNKQPDRIQLQEIYCAIEDRKAFYLYVNQSKSNQNNNGDVNDYFLELFADIQKDIEEKMRKITLQHVLNYIR